MKPGLYRLTRDVENAKRDKRVNYDRDWTHAPVWTKDTVFEVRQYEGELPKLAKLHQRYRHSNYLLVWPANSGDRGNAYAAPEALLAALVPYEATTVEEALMAEDLEAYATQALQWMVNTSRLTLENVLTAARDAQQAANDEWDRQEAERENRRAQDKA